MESRRSSLLIGSRTRRNVLEGKNVRKEADGADKFADYWTDSDGESTESSVTHEQSDLSQMQQATGISEPRLRTLRQKVRKAADTKLFHSQTEVIGKLPQSSHTRSPLKSMKNNISSIKDVNRSLANKQKFSSEQDVHHSRTRNLSNNSTLSDDSSNHHEDEFNASSNSFQHSTSNVNVLGETKIIANFSSTETNNVNEALVTGSEVRRSKNMNKEESIESRTCNNSVSAARDGGKKTQTKDSSLKNADQFENGIEPSSVSQHSISEDNAMRRFTINAGSPISEKNDGLEKTFVMEKSVPNSNLNTSDIRVLSKTRVKHNVTGSAESDIQLLSGKTLDEENNFVPPLRRISSTLLTTFGNRTVKKITNSLQVSKTFEKFDEYDAEIMQMVCENEEHKNLKLLQKEHSSSKKLKHYPIDEKKAQSSPSKRIVKPAEETLEDKTASDEALGSFKESQRSYNLRSVDKIHNGSEQKTEIPEKENGVTPSLGNKKKKSVTKTNENLKDSDNVPLNNFKSATEIPEKKKEISQSLHNKGKKSVNKTAENLKSSETFTKDNIKSGSKGRVSDVGEINDEAPLSFDSKRKKHVNKTNNKKVKPSENILQVEVESATEFPEKESRTTPSPQNERENPVNNIIERLRVSDTSYRSIRDKRKMSEISDMVNTRSLQEKKRKQEIERNERTFQGGDNDQVSVSLKKKPKAKKIAACATDNIVPIRKSARQKFPPLAKWRNERLLYRVEDGIINFVGIDQGTKEDDNAIKQIITRNQVRSKAKKKKEKIKKFTVDCVLEKKKIRLSLVKKFDNVPWDKGYENDECPYRIKRCFETLNSAFGYMEIKVNGEKPKQYMPSEELYLFVIKGKIQITLQDNMGVVEENDTFVIPRCVPYSLKNIGTRKACLVYCVGKFQFLESLE